MDGLHRKVLNLVQDVADQIVLERYLPNTVVRHLVPNTTPDRVELMVRPSFEQSNMVVFD